MGLSEICNALIVSALHIKSGERGIRTPGPVTVNSFQDCRNRPLCHLSAAKVIFHRIQPKKTTENILIQLIMKILPLQFPYPSPLHYIPRPLKTDSCHSSPPLVFNTIIAWYFAPAGKGRLSLHPIYNNAIQGRFFGGNTNCRQQSIFSLPRKGRSRSVNKMLCSPANRFPAPFLQFCPRISQ